jgi:ketosteroid isomerase-like protein
MSCTISLVARANGATVRQPFAEVLRFRDGRLLEGTPFYYDTNEILSALG